MSETDREKKESETYSHKETVKRREEALKRMLNTPKGPRKLIKGRKQSQS